MEKEVAEVSLINQQLADMVMRQQAMMEKYTTQFQKYMEKMEIIHTENKMILMEIKDSIAQRGASVGSSLGHSHDSAESEAVLVQAATETMEKVGNGSESVANDKEKSVQQGSSE